MQNSSILISGSLAYDYLFTFPGVFQNEILTGNVGNLSIAFVVTGKDIFFGGCAGNIVFNAKLLKEDFLLLGIAGKDFAPYEKWLKEHKINVSHIIRKKAHFTSSATIVTDQRSQQITFFHPGAAAYSNNHVREIKNTIKKSAKNLRLALISPNDKNFMVASIEACRQNKIPFIFDPGQAMPLFKPHELKNILEHSCGLMLNEYELNLFKRLTGMSLKEILNACKLLIVTLGEKGSEIYFNAARIPIAAIKPQKIIDPTGCGDAYRAGFLSGIKTSFPKLTPSILERAGILGANIAAKCLGSRGTQNHKFN